MPQLQHRQQLCAAPGVTLFPMTTHELARLLLTGPDCPALVPSMFVDERMSAPAVSNQIVHDDDGKPREATIIAPAVTYQEIKRASIGDAYQNLKS